MHPAYDPLFKNGANLPLPSEPIPSHLPPVMPARQLTRPRLPEAASSDGAPTPEFIASLRDGYRMSAADMACHNAVTNNDTKSLALNRAALRGKDGHVSQVSHCIYTAPIPA